MNIAAVFDDGELKLRGEKVRQKRREKKNKLFYQGRVEEIRENSWPAIRSVPSMP